MDCLKSSLPWSVPRSTVGFELDPQGYLALYAPEVTYFDPFADSRVDGLDAMEVRLAPMKDIEPPFTNPRYEMIDPKVQRNGDVALLTFNLVNYGRPPDASGACPGSLECHRGLQSDWRARGRSSTATGRSYSRSRTLRVHRRTLAAETHHRQIHEPGAWRET